MKASVRDQLAGSVDGAVPRAVNAGVIVDLGGASIAAIVTQDLGVPR